jgi:hypothetical protein
MKQISLNRFAMAGALAAAITLVAGCKTAAPVTERQTYIEPVRFNPDGYLGKDVRVKNENDPQQLINFALSLAARGRHNESAGFFQEAAAKFLSEDNDLAVNCRAAAANEYLLAGDIAAFREAVQGLKKEMSRFQSAAVDKQTATVLALGDIALGVDKPAPTTPAALWELYSNSAATKEGGK